MQASGTANGINVLGIRPLHDTSPIFSLTGRMYLLQSHAETRTILFSDGCVMMARPMKYIRFRFLRSMSPMAGMR
jgi:hypothetical protein